MLAFAARGLTNLTTVLPDPVGFADRTTLPELTETTVVPAATVPVPLTFSTISPALIKSVVPVLIPLTVVDPVDRVTVSC